jgi:hypothetical protein
MKEFCKHDDHIHGEHCLRGFNNRDIRARLASTVHLRARGQDPIKESAKVSRTFRRFHAHGLIAKVPRTRRWRVTTDAALWELRSVSGNTTSRRRIPESPHDPLGQMQRSHGKDSIPVFPRTKGGWLDLIRERFFHPLIYNADMPDNRGGFFTGAGRPGTEHKISGRFQRC